MPLKSGFTGLKQHVEAEPWDAAVEEEEGEGVRGQLQVPLKAPLLKGPAGGLQIDQRLPLLHEIDDTTQPQVEDFAGLGIGEVELEWLLDRDRLGAVL